MSRMPLSARLRPRLFKDLESTYLQVVWCLVIYITALQQTTSAQFPAGLQEQAIIVAYGGSLSSNETLTNSTGSINLVCVAFGLPSPQVTWQSRDQIAAEVTVNITEFETYIETNGTRLSYTVSILQFCNVSSLAQLTDYTCTAENGITSEQSIGDSFNITFDAIATDTMTTDVVTMDTATTNEITMTTREITTSDSTDDSVPDSSVTMTALIIAVAVVVCVVALSVAIMVSTLIAVLVLRNKRSTQSSSTTAEYESRMYANSLYDGTAEWRQQRGNDDNEELYTCEAYTGVTADVHEYTYVTPITGLHQLDQSASKTAHGAGVEDFAVYHCAAYNAVSEVTHSYEETCT